MTKELRVGIILALGTLLYFFVNFQRVAIPGTIFNELQMAYEVPASYITALGSSFMYIYAVNQLVAGVLSDRYGGIRVICVGGFLFCLGAFLFSASSSLFMMYFSRAILGFGASAIYLSLTKETGRYFAKNFTVVFGVILLVGYAGSIVANAPFILCMKYMDWQKILMVIVGVMATVYACFLIMSRFVPQYEVNRNISISARTFLDVIKIKHNQWLCIYAAGLFSSYYVMQTMLGKKFLQDFCQIDSLKAGIWMSAMGALSAVSNVVTGVLSRLMGNRRRCFMRYAGISGFTAGVGLVLSLLLDYRGIGVPLLLFLLTLSANLSPVLVALTKESNKAEVMGVAVSLQNFICYASVAILGNVTGLLMDVFPAVKQGEAMVYGTKSYLLVFGLLLLLTGISGWHSFKLKETYGQSRK